MELTTFIEAIENALGKSAIRELVPLQPGDVGDTFADVVELERQVGYRPKTPVDVGVLRFVEWYRGFYDAGCDGMGRQETS